MYRCLRHLLLRLSNPNLASIGSIVAGKTSCFRSILPFIFLRSKMVILSAFTTKSKIGCFDCCYSYRVESPWYVLQWLQRVNTTYYLWTCDFAYSNVFWWCAGYEKSSGGAVNGIWILNFVILASYTKRHNVKCEKLIMRNPNLI